jgi:prepilin-type N-terminal cleavage/methylation domain-containing protein
MNCSNRFNKNFGFSLVELSIVIVIMGMMMGAGLKYLAAQSENAVYSSTLKRQETIKLALVSYFRTHKNLPCPDTRPGGGNTGTFSTTNIPDGVENRNSATVSPPDTTQTCDANFGIVPFQTLGFSRDVALDGWENYMSYRVYYPASGAVNDWVRTTSFNAGNSGAVTVNDRYPANSATTSNKTTTAVVAIISHGKNGLGAYTIKGTRNVLPSPNTLDEYQNTVGTGNIFSRELSEDTSNTVYGVFDDLVVYLTSSDILDPLFMQGSIIAPEAELATELNQIKNKIIGYVLTDNNCSTPASLASVGVTGSLLLDPWGSNYVYTEDLSEIQQDGDADNNAGSGVNEATHVAFSLTSYGPDKSSGGSDNTTITMTPNDLAAIMGGNYMDAECP